MTIMITSFIGRRRLRLRLISTECIMIIAVLISSSAITAFMASKSTTSSILSTPTVVDPTTKQVNAPVVKVSLYEESFPMLYVSKLVYHFGAIVKAARNAEIVLKVPVDFPIELKDFQDKSLALSNKSFNNGNGLSLVEMMEVIQLNKESIATVLGEESAYGLAIIEDIARFKASCKVEHDEGMYFLCVYRSIEAKISCVYGIIKDVCNKRIIIAFRGSQKPDLSTRDWRSNLKANVVELETPALIREKLDEDLKEHVYVHEGFHDYLFENKRRSIQIYTRIVEDVKPLIEDGYSVYVTGHSLGGALAHLLSFKLAGDEDHRDWLPKPITCISYAAPYSGASGYRTAMEQLEKDGLLRSLRVTNGEDIVPASPPFSLGFPFRTMKHTGINLRLTKNGYSTVHSSVGGFKNAVKNTFLKPVWRLLTWHGLQLHDSRMDEYYKDLSKVTIDDLYKDQTVVSKEFAEGKAKSNHNED
ncbi:alpha/beta-hydrolase [Fragilariopsis cylindrus CCMP1102]|uniref:Alpha/beta-hydrolase n=1 Tax=Fragilariopsis cylindrus CCMP1102 TaxID=635003 RepID=A0A1E7EL82_9STRA|nr:alpha/beta-hydrolase [Fragilariopsis cylindrus CCMP1102]|eukprot:OEU06672.1 alpha/beta-hydrolase [Fragilariopsis cylindrus CCMP1102]